VARKNSPPHTLFLGLTVALGLAAAPALAVPAPTSAAPAHAAGSKPRPGRARRAAPNAPVELFHVNHKESMQLRLRDDHGRPVRGQQKRFDHFLRCHYTNVQHAMNPRLISLLYQTGRHWPGRRLEVVSGYRHPNFAKNPHSPHMKGLACDFRVVGVTNQQLRDYLRQTFNKVGVGYYPNSSFVHLDVRKDRSAFWIDYSGPGERAVYSAAPSQDLRDGRADRYHPSKIDESWVDSDAAPAAGAEAAAPAATASAAAAAPSAAPPGEEPAAGP
jgi:uncharacterized protein YcbK (DUF882 family)